MNRLLSMGAARAVCIALPLFLLLCSSRDQSLKKDAEIGKYRTLYESGDWTVRKQAVAKASRVLSPEGTDLLLKATEDTHTLVRIEAISGLRRHKTPRALERVRELIETSADHNIRWQALKTMGYYREPTAALLFAKNLKHDDWLIREESIKGLLKIDDYAIRYVSVPYVLEALRDPSMSVKLTTLKYLRVTDPRIYTRLSAMLLSSENRQHTLVRETLNALREYDLDAKTREKVIGYLTHQNRDIRLVAYRVLVAQDERDENRKAPSR